MALTFCYYFRTPFAKMSASDGSATAGVAVPDDIDDILDGASRNIKSHTYYSGTDRYSNCPLCEIRGK